MRGIFLITLFLVSIPSSRSYRSRTTPRSSPGSETRWKFDSENSDAYRTRTRRFTKPVITWRIDKFSSTSNLSNADLTHGIRTAMDAWSDVVPIEFRQICDPSAQVDIAITFLDSNIDHKTDRILDDRLAITTYDPMRILFSGDVKYVIGNAESDTNKDLFTIALHELGHALGLRGHSTVPDSLMAEEYIGRFTQLPADVVREIQSLYGVRIQPRHPSTALHCSTSMAPVTTATPSANASIYCTPGQYYCGWQMKDMGYKVNWPTVLYRCDNGRRGVEFASCSETQCIHNERFGAHCRCSVSHRFCGYNVEEWFNIKVSQYRAVYKCAPSTVTGIEVVETCPDSCANGQCKTVRHACEPGKLHCGHELMRRGLILSPPNNFDVHALYHCNNTSYSQVKRCPGRCWGDTHRQKDSYCLTNAVEIRPSP